MKKITPKILKGFRDFLPEKKIIRESIIKTVKEVYERFGFVPLETPALEYAETLLGKYGEETDVLVYQFKDCGGREVVLRYDLTVPLARVIAMYPELPKPFKRYQIAPVWRAEKPQRGRFREFIQCDIDIVGTSSMMADSEIVSIMYKTMKALGFDRFITQINNRKILDGLVTSLQIDKGQSPVIFRILDKFEKIGSEEVKKELLNKGFNKGTVNRLLQFIQIKGSNKEILSLLKKMFPNNSEVLKGVEELKLILNYAKVGGVPEENLKINLGIVRGLDYYTGSVFETVLLDSPKVGSVFGGGRYDNLIGTFFNKEIPAVGVSLGVDRLFSAIETTKILPTKISTSRVLVTIFDESTKVQSLKIADKLRRSGINAEIYFDKDNLEKQFTYAYKKGIPLAIILGPKELKNKRVALKDLRSGEQKTIEVSNLIENLKRIK